ncbi:unnamed protein product [Gongylonema pulchrum]|uniref:Transposase n=1 Tax=Gongylonema pulchrum TaxID=637853 RepID=A0A183D270_9BILA|nr:unnamed protein product [Gongylonema pulchrum]
MAHRFDAKHHNAERGRKQDRRAVRPIPIPACWKPAPWLAFGYEFIKFFHLIVITGHDISKNLNGIDGFIRAQAEEECADL